VYADVFDREAYVFSRFLRLIRHALPSWLARGPKRLGLKDISMPAGGIPAAVGRPRSTTKRSDAWCPPTEA
jgi:hypothetical protein